MGIADITFYVFATTLVAAALLVVVARNPVHSVLWLILAFLSAAGLFVLLGAEFVAMLLIIVYVGAVAVLFLFVVMMLDVDFAALKAEMVRYIPLAGLIGIVLLMQLALVYGTWVYSEGIDQHLGSPIPPLHEVHNTRAIGLILYDRYVLPFQLSGLILLIAMVGAILLTLRHRQDVKRQNILTQIYRDPAKAMELRDVKPGQGLRR
ncbi:MAG: NADH-quinone oxidoreductase subunit J [Rhodobacteraceae bacterium]|nr:NADH-quinone oxidoreductase subunit J [Paracoccaceae bacterium]